MGNINYNRFIKQNIAPYAATMIAAYDTEGRYVGHIPLGQSFKPQFGDRLYRFGVLSDVHNRVDNNNKTEATADLQRALTHFNNKESVEFVCICGDLTEDGTKADLQIYNQNVINYSNSTPVYTCTGNHDVRTTFGTSDTSKASNLGNWTSLTGMSGKHALIQKIHTTGRGKTITDNFVFFSMNSYYLGSSGNPYSQDDITWLTNTLAAHEEERTFIFMHMFFPDRAGNYGKIYPSGNWMSNPSVLNPIQELCDRYPNTIWFSGHSHWNWNLQGRPYGNTGNNYDANIWPPNDTERPGGWCVHIPSCASPIDSTDSKNREEDNYDVESQLAIVDVYEKYIDIRGMTLINGQLKYMPIAQYRLDTDFVVTYHPTNDDLLIRAEWLYLNDGKNSPYAPKYGEENGPINTKLNGKDAVQIKFTAKSQGYFVLPDYITNSNPTSAVVANTNPSKLKIRIEDIKIVNRNEVDITRDVTGAISPYIGFYGSKYRIAVGEYYSSDITIDASHGTTGDTSHGSTTYAHCAMPQFNTSSSAQNGVYVYPITVTIRAFADLNYGGTQIYRGQLETDTDE